MLELILNDFTWERPVSPKKGFMWRSWDNERQLIRVPGAEFVSYNPHAGIFRDFADLKQTPEAVLQFANRYGMLRNRLDFNDFSFWRMGIQQMSELVPLGDAIVGDDWKAIPKALEPFIGNPLRDSEYLRPVRAKQERREQVTRDELAHAAIMCLYHAISPLHRFEPVASWNSRLGKVELRLKFCDLINFIYYQLGHAVIGRRKFRQCPTCGKWFVLIPGVNRADRSLCSGYCRLKLSRQRKAAAIKLHNEGWTPKQIAEQVDSSVYQVKQWIGEASA